MQDSAHMSRGYPKSTGKGIAALTFGMEMPYSVYIFGGKFCHWVGLTPIAVLVLRLWNKIGRPKPHPNPTNIDFPYNGRRNTKPSSYILMKPSLGEQFKNCADILGSQLGSRSVTALTNRIPRIVHLCTNKKMGGIYARRVVTRMTGLTLAGWALIQYQSNSMGIQKCSRYMKCAVSSFSTTSHPQPTIIWRSLLDATMKPLYILSGKLYWLNAGIHSDTLSFIGGCSQCLL